VHICAAFTIDPKPNFQAYKNGTKGDDDIAFFDQGEPNWGKPVIPAEEAVPPDPRVPVGLPG
jgi:hypothetical protein